jgi:hypothetical protein
VLANCGELLKNPLENAGSFIYVIVKRRNTKRTVVKEVIKSRSKKIKKFHSVAPSLYAIPDKKKTTTPYRRISRITDGMAAILLPITKTSAR